MRSKCVSVVWGGESAAVVSSSANSVACMPQPSRSNAAPPRPASPRPASPRPATPHPISPHHSIAAHPTLYSLTRGLHTVYRLPASVSHRQIKRVVVQLILVKRVNPRAGWLRLTNAQCAAFSVHRAVCSMQHAACSVQRVACSVRRAVCSVKCAMCSVQRTACSVQCAECSVQLAACSV